MPDATSGKPATLSDLLDAGIRTRSVKWELREHLIAGIRSGETLFPGILGFDHTVLPQIENALLSGQDLVLLGKRGQAKTRIMRSLANLLDPEIPAVAGCDLRDDPFAPVCMRCRNMVRDLGGRTPIRWVPRSERYTEKLATPDITMADLIGDLDPVKIAEGRTLSDMETIHFGLIPRAHRGIFAVNELPDLPERMQVGLFNILEERDVQIRGFALRLPLDLYVAASANPEDYTNRGRIITPLKDRFGSQVNTHYPLSRDLETAIMDQERKRFPEEEYTEVPGFMKDIVAEISRRAREHPDVDPRSGVSVRASIHNLENLVSNALRRRLRLNEPRIVPRVTDLAYLVPSTLGKIELESLGDLSGDVVFAELVRKAVSHIFETVWGDYDFTALLDAFGDSRSFVVSDTLPAVEYERQGAAFQGVRDLWTRMNAWSPEHRASVIEFVLEGLTLRGKLERQEVSGSITYARGAR